LKPLPSQHAALVETAIQAAQSAGDLPAFDIPTIEIKPPKKTEQGDYAYAGPMALAKPTGMKPIDIAQAIHRHLPSAGFVGRVEVLPPGFINFRLDETWLRAQIDSIIAEGQQLFRLDLGAGKRAQVEFVSANPTGPLHIGRSRGAIVGDSIARVLEAAGYSVEREYYFNNAGVQMKNLGESMRQRYLQALGLPVDEDSLKYRGEYLIEFARQLVAEKGSAWTEADWPVFKEYAEARMFDMIKATLARIDIHHDIFFNESDLYTSGAIQTVLEQLEARGLIYEAVVPEGEKEDDLDAHGEERRARTDGKQPAKWFRSTQFGDDRDRVMVKSDGDPTYTLPDIAYHVNKIERGFDLLVNILGADHFVQHQVVRRGVQALDLDAGRISVIIVQFVRLVRDGVEVKMSTRSGDYETLDDLIDLTSADAVRYLLLARSANSHLDFDLDLAVKQSSDNPVYYIQYAHVRCAGILREAAARGVDDQGADLSLLGAEELAFIRKMLELGEQIEQAALMLTPHSIAFYALELANLFHPMYDRVRVFGEGVSTDVAKARLRFYRAAQVTFHRVLRLMGMTAPERM
jgi:arginyl-tRNA synthetase